MGTWSSIELCTRLVSWNQHAQTTHNTTSLSVAMATGTVPYTSNFSKFCVTNASILGMWKNDSSKFWKRASYCEHTMSPCARFLHSSQRVYNLQPPQSSRVLLNALVTHYQHVPAFHFPLFTPHGIKQVLISDWGKQMRNSSLWNIDVWVLQATPFPSLVLSLHTPPGETLSGEKSLIPWAYCGKDQWNCEISLYYVALLLQQ